MHHVRGVRVDAHVAADWVEMRHFSGIEEGSIPEEGSNVALISRRFGVERQHSGDHGWVAFGSTHTCTQAARSAAAGIGKQAGTSRGVEKHANNGTGCAGNIMPRQQPVQAHPHPCFRCTASKMRGLKKRTFGVRPAPAWPAPAERRVEWEAMRGRTGRQVNMHATPHRRQTQQQRWPWRLHRQQSGSSCGSTASARQQAGATSFQDAQQQLPPLPSSTKLSTAATSVWKGASGPAHR